MTLNLIYITNDPAVALVAEKCGVERIMVDLETLGKEERQRNMNSVKSHHSIEDIKKIKPLLTKSEMLVRINPMNANSNQEINDVIASGADIIMLPMWKTKKDVLNFIHCVAGRTKTMLLLETKEAVECLDDILSVGGIDEIHIGLNDLHLSYGMKFMFELLANGCVESLCEKIGNANIPFGFGGIAKLGGGLLPAENIIIEHYRLKSSMVILSRSFCDSSQIENLDEFEKAFTKNMKELRSYEKIVSLMDDSCFQQNRNEISNAVKKIVTRCN